MKHSVTIFENIAQTQPNFSLKLIANLKPFRVHTRIGRRVFKPRSQKNSWLTWNLLGTAKNQKALVIHKDFPYFK